MRRIWLEGSDLNQSQIELSGDAFHHAIQVCRFREGDVFELVNGTGIAAAVRLERVQKNMATVVVLDRRNLPELRDPKITLVVASSKWATFESILEKAVELGVKDVQPLMTEFSFIRSHKDWPDSRSERLTKIIRAATEQSARGQPLQLHKPLMLKDYLNQINLDEGTGGLFAYEAQNSLSVKNEQLKAGLTKMQSKKLTNIHVLVGSEGGWSEAEAMRIVDKRFVPLSLGQQILRVETACLALISVIKHEFECF